MDFAYQYKMSDFCLWHYLKTIVFVLFFFALWDISLSVFFSCRTSFIFIPPRPLSGSRAHDGSCWYSAGKVFQAGVQLNLIPSCTTAVKAVASWYSRISVASIRHTLPCMKAVYGGKILWSKAFSVIRGVHGGGWHFSFWYEHVACASMKRASMKRGFGGKGGGAVVDRRDRSGEAS